MGCFLAAADGWQYGEDIAVLHLCLESVECCCAFSVDEELEEAAGFSVFGVVDVFGEGCAVALLERFEDCFDGDCLVVWEGEGFFFFADCFAEAGEVAD